MSMNTNKNTEQSHSTGAAPVGQACVVAENQVAKIPAAVLRVMREVYGELPPFAASRGVSFEQWLTTFSAREMWETYLKWVGILGFADVLWEVVVELSAHERQEAEGIVTVTTNKEGVCVAVTRQDEEGRILKVIWAAK